MQYNDSYPPSSTIHLTFPERGDLPPVKLHWYDGGLLPERPEDLEPERRLPESGTIFVGDKGKMWCETYSESPRLIPESAMQAFQRPAQDAAAGCRMDARATRRTGSMRFARRGRPCRTSTTPVRSRRRVLLGNVALRFPGERLMWDAANHEGHQHSPRPTSIVPATTLSEVRAGRSGVHRGQTSRSCVPMHRTSTAGSGSRDLASSAICGASRTRR